MMMSSSGSKPEKSILDSSSSESDSDEIDRTPPTKVSSATKLKSLLKKLSASTEFQSELEGNNATNDHEDVLTSTFASTSETPKTPSSQEFSIESRSKNKSLMLIPSPLSTPSSSATSHQSPKANITNSDSCSIINSSDRSEQDDIKEVLAQILEQNKKVVDQNVQLLERVSRLEEEVNASKSRKKRDNGIEVPNDVRYHVRSAFNKKKNEGEQLWNYESANGPFSEENLPLTNYIRTYVKGVFTNLENRDAIINKAIKTYFNSKVIEKKRSKNQNFSRDTARHQGKIHKANRRKKAFVNHVTMTNPDLKDLSLRALIPDMMSSEDDQEDENGQRYFLTHKPKYRTKKFEKLLKLSDKAYLANASRRAKDQYVTRRQGEPSDRSPPKSLPEQCKNLFVNSDV